jgi:hypothetical protein
LVAPLAASGIIAAALRDLTIFQDALLGLGLGTLIGKLLVRRQERRRGDQLPPDDVRRIETAWMLAGVVFSVAAGLVVPLG